MLYLYTNSQQDNCLYLLHCAVFKTIPLPLAFDCVPLFCPVLLSFAYLCQVSPSFASFRPVSPTSQNACRQGQSTTADLHSATSAASRRPLQPYQAMNILLTATASFLIISAAVAAIISPPSSAS
jgi:hypothetical protein